MQFLAQAGLGAAGGGVAALVSLVSAAIFVTLAFVAAWFGLPSMIRLICDIILKRSPFSESEADRAMEGRVFSTSVRRREGPSRD